MKCRNCDSEKLEMFLDLGEQPHCDNFLTEEELKVKEPFYPLQACFCHDCTTVQINYTVPKEIMFNDFDYLSGTTKTLRKHFEDSADRLVKKVGLKKYDLVVDIGSNDGTWLSNYKKYEMRILGVDPAVNIAKIANAAGIETWATFFDRYLAKDIIKEEGKANLITAAGVFFHLEELHSVTEGVKKLLNKNGTFCIQSIYLGGIIKNNAFDQIYHEHLTYWTVKSLTKLLEKYELEIYDVSLLPIHGGSLEVLVGHEGEHNIDDSVRMFLKNELEQGLDKIETYHKFSNRVWKIQEELVNILLSYKMAGRSVYAYGAPAKGSTLLNSFGITSHFVPNAVEVNPLKIGKYIPGCRILILDENTAPSPDAYLLLAWNFLGEFLKKKEDYIKSGGEFIVPVPIPTIINKSNWESFK